MNTSIEKSPASTSTADRMVYATPAANILRNGGGYLLEAEMPGVGKDGLEVTVEDNTITIVGHRADKEAPGQALYRESRPVDYRRVFDLDPDIDAEKISAKIDQGVLTLALPKSERSQTPADRSTT